MRGASLTFAALSILALAPGSAPAQSRSLEAPVKAAFLYKFGSFVEWPPGVLPAPGGAVQLCVVGNDPFGAVLDDVVKGQTIDMRRIVVRRLPVITSSSPCHVAYLAGSEAQSSADAANALAGAPVLTVAGEEAGVGHVAIQFVLRANRVRFRVDQRVATASGLTISSKLLNLATEVMR